MAPALIIPSAQYLQSYLEACREFKARGVAIDGYHDPDAADTWVHTVLDDFERVRQGVGLKPGYVPASTFWLVEGDAYVGTGGVRHRLTPALERYGGHIGYFVRPSRWNMGYGTRQLRLLLDEACMLGIERALITCDEDNAASARVIEKNGGVWQDTIDNTIRGRHVRTKRYWVAAARSE